jgi:hypothetical protein
MLLFFLTVYMLISMPTDTSTIFGAFQVCALPASKRQRRFRVESPVSNGGVYRSDSSMTFYVRFCGTSPSLRPCFRLEKRDRQSDQENPQSHQDRSCNQECP